MTWTDVGLAYALFAAVCFYFVLRDERRYGI